MSNQTHDLVAIMHALRDAKTLEERRDALKALVEWEDHTGNGEVTIGYTDDGKGFRTARPTLEELAEVEFQIRKREVVESRVR